MKKPLQLLVFLMAFMQAVAQVPQQINYQGVARNSVGSVIANQNISLRLSIRDGATSGPIVYSETRTLKTNNFGLFVTAIGAPGATSVTGSFASVDWGRGVKFLQVEMDPKGAGSFIDMGTSQLLSVPYAMYAGAAPPTGNAGGDLEGNYPSPVIKDGSVTNSKIADGQISATKLQAGVIPASLPPNGAAGGDLNGTYPNPVLAAGAVDNNKLSDNSVGTSKLQDASVTAQKLAAGVIPTSLPPNGSAGGDLTGTYPNPVIADQVVTSSKLSDGAVSTTKIADNAVGTTKIQDGAITSAKLAPGLIPTATTPTGNAGGDLGGFYPNPVVADNAITTNKIADGSVTAIKLSAGVIPTALPPNGTAGGDLTGTYPNPTISNGAVGNAKLADNSVSTSKIQDASVTAQKLAPGIIPTALPPTGTAGGDLTGTYPNPTISNGAVGNAKLADNSISTSKIQDASVTAQKLAPGIIPTALPPTGTAGGDLTGTYPNPTISNGAVGNAKLADNSVSTSKIQDASVTAQKLAPGIIPTALPPNGTAGGDLSGTYPNPVVSQIRGITVANTAPTSGQVLKFNGSAWAPANETGGTGTPSGNAGGDLSGTYPNPTIATGAVDNNKLADNSVSTAKIQDASVTSQKLAAGVIPTALPPTGTAGGDLSGSYPNPSLNKIKGITLSNTAPAAGQVLKYDGTQWIPSADITGTGGSPTGSAGGDLSGNYPNPSIASGAVTAPKLANGSVNTPKLADGAVNQNKLADLAVSTSKILDGAVTAAKLAPGVIPTSLPPSGSAGGDLTGTYPNPLVADNTITTTKIADGNITASKLAAGVIPTALPPNGTAGGDLTGTYPNPLVADNAITSSKIADGSITSNKLAAGVLPTTLPPNGTAGGDLSGSYPNPVVSQIQGIAVGNTAPASGQVLKFNGTAWVPAADDAGSGGGSPTGNAGGDLAGTYPNPVIASGAVDNSKLADNSVGTTKIQDASVTAQKLAAGVLPTALPPTGTAGGDLTGSYPNPAIASGAVDNSKLADNSVSTTKIQDASVTAQKLAAGLIPTSLPPNGAAGGDLTGTYPNPLVADNAISSTKIADNAITNTKIADGSVTASKLASGVLPTSLPPNGAAGGDLSGNYPAPVVSRIQGIPVSSTAPASGQILKYDGSKWAAAAESAGGSFSLPYGATSSSATDLFSITNNGTATALQGINGNTGDNVTAVLGAITSTSPGNLSAGVKGMNYGTGTKGVGVYGTHAGTGYGVYGSSNGGSGVYGFSPSGNGVVAESVSGRALSSTSVNGNAGFFDVSDATSSIDAVYVHNTGNGNGMTVMSEQGIGIQAMSNNLSLAGVQAFNLAGGTGISGVTFGAYGPGVQAIGGADGTTPLIADLWGTTGDVARFQSNQTNVARIDATGKGFFNGGTQTGGADLAEAFDVEGSKASYEAGDVLIISTSSDRTVEKSQTPYSTLVAGVYATKPGVLLTEKTQQEPIDDMVPMGVIGVIPTKVCTEGGAIKRGDLLVTSSTAGVAMKGDPDKLKIGQVIGKALEDFDGSGTGKIKVLVSIK